MQLIFIISGASIFFALRPGEAMRFLRDRFMRLLVPLALGILVLAPPQVFMERVTHGDFKEPFSISCRASSPAKFWQARGRAFTCGISNIFLCSRWC